MVGAELKAIPIPGTTFTIDLICPDCYHLNFYQSAARPSHNQMKWFEQVVRKPEYETVQSDGRIRRWGRMDEAGGKVLRVILLTDGETAYSVFFD